MICEGDGDQAALPLLLRRIAAARGFEFTVGWPRNAHGKGNLVKPGGVEEFFRFAVASADALLIVLDADEDCPVDLASALAGRVRALRPAIPVAVVAANGAFETWFLADLDSIEGRMVKGRVLIPATGPQPSDPDGIPNPKTRLGRMTPDRTAYRETADQPSLASMIDLDVVFGRSRSFRRLADALSQLGEAVAAGRAGVTP